MRRVLSVIPANQSLFPNLDQNYLPAAKAFNDFANGYALVFSYTPSGPLFEYDPSKVPEPPRTISDLKDWIIAHPHKFLYATPPNSGPGRTLLMGLPYLLGDSDPTDPTNGWSNTWAFLKAINGAVRPYPTRTGDTMSGLANDTSWMIASTLGWYINPRALNQVPASAKWVMLQNTTFVSDAAFMLIPKGLDAAHKAVALDLMAFMLKPDQQALTFDTGYFYPGPAIQNVAVTSAPLPSRAVLQTYGDKNFDALIRSTPIRPPLSATNLVTAFNMWNQMIGGAS